MDTLASQALEWLGAYTYAVVFVGMLIDASGLPFPGRLLLVAAGALNRTEYGTLLGVIALAVAAAMVMDLAWYVAGRRGGERVIAFYRKLPGWRGRRRRRAASNGVGAQPITPPAGETSMPPARGPSSLAAGAARRTASPRLARIFRRARSVARHARRRA